MFRGARSERSSPLRFEGSSVVILQAKRVVLGRVAVGHPEHAAPVGPTVGDAVRLLRRHHELLAGLSIHDAVTDLYRETLVQDDPRLVAKLVVVLARLLPRLDRDDAHRRGLIQSIRGHLAPGLLHDHDPSLLVGSRALDAGSRSPDRSSPSTLTIWVA